MTYLLDSRVTAIVIHYSATPIESDFTAADIDQMHRARGYKEIGYHYFIRKDGTIETGRDLSQAGRFEQGAHSFGENDSSIGICYEGGVRRGAMNLGYDSRTDAQKDAMAGLIADLLERFPGAVVRGHRDMPGAATQCPGFNATAWWDDVLAQASNDGLAQAGASPSPDVSRGLLDDLKALVARHDRA
ncbi:N-acetylmuramoyl-L-alanine amidase [Loktanella sp. 3ANDIMAR09]|uniref:N-acetylmuramoyl-L-alanine amidase n=1 Tax=Loktanella sp. 3ANDIMAR09 TaxID=1225657 RepID=UPI0006F81528|nr:N-acetylmuramoyl-L-alanine amidase [Loktanella sp. 3ANDIMAR09]